MNKGIRTKADRRKYIWTKANGVCAHCGKQTSPNCQTIDHVIPKYLDGGNDLRNLMPLCRKCNGQRGSNEVDLTDYYRFAAPEALEDLQDYILSWRLSHQDSYGTLIMEHPERKLPTVNRDEQQ